MAHVPCTRFVSSARWSALASPSLSKPCTLSSRLAGRGRRPIVKSAAISSEAEVLHALEGIIDPDLGENIVDCGFVKDLDVNRDTGNVAFRLELTTPACPVKDEFQRQAIEFVENLEWVENVDVTMDAQARQPIDSMDGGRPGGLAKVNHVVAVYSCKGGVGKSTVAVNLAYTLAQMGAKVGIFDADVYGPSLPTMVNPELRVMEMDPETKAIKPTVYEGVKLVSFGFAGQGSAIMRGPMVSGVVQQLLTQADWGELDYLIMDFPPGTGDIQLTLCQTVALSAAVVVTTPQKLAFVDVAKGIRMFARLMVPCVSVVENMSYFEVDGVRHLPFGSGSGDRISADYGLKHLIRFPIVPDLSMAGDDGRPLVVSDPVSDVARAFGELGATVVQEIAKLRMVAKTCVRFDSELRAFVVNLPGAKSDQEFILDPAVVRRNDTSARSVNEWTGEKIMEEVADDIVPEAVNPLGNYAVQILWEDNFNQVASFDLLESLPRLDATERKEQLKSLGKEGGSEEVTAAQKIMAAAQNP
ncbi:hypothetical protein BSKO_00252 [Bryopsis sp. KO-2023]|nr:hypothetical protein BSKO_00252 [Bryopsis sp. KO-2023]